MLNKIQNSRYRLPYQRVALIIVLCFVILPTYALKNGKGKRLTRAEYINIYKDVAIDEMNKFRIPASITLAQGCLESGNGNSTLSTRDKNHFGIKCGGSWRGKKSYHDDDAKGECFRVYKSAKESYRDHSLFLTNNRRYSTLFTYKITDYKSWARGLKKAGYATNPQYANLLIRIIEDNELYKYDSKKRSKSSKSNQTTDTYPTIKVYEIHKFNKTKAVIATAGDTYKSIAKSLNMTRWELTSYNEPPENYNPVTGEVVYIQVKSKKADKAYSTYRVKQGETAWSISQKFGIRLKSLYRLNRLPKSEDVKAGMVLNLRKRVDKR